MRNNFYSEIYRNFYIKIYGRSSGRSYNQLAGIPLLLRLLGRPLLHSLLSKALYSDLEVVTFKLRRGLTITFYAK